MGGGAESQLKEIILKNKNIDLPEGST